jgi:hypothetical protein
MSGAGPTEKSRVPTGPGFFTSGGISDGASGDRASADLILLQVRNLDLDAPFALKPVEQ